MYDYVHHNFTDLEKSWFARCRQSCAVQTEVIARADEFFVVHGSGRAIIWLPACHILLVDTVARGHKCGQKRMTQNSEFCETNKFCVLLILIVCFCTNKFCVFRILFETYNQDQQHTEFCVRMRVHGTQTEGSTQLLSMAPLAFAYARMRAYACVCVCICIFTHTHDQLSHIPHMAYDDVIHFRNFFPALQYMHTCIHTNKGPPHTQRTYSHNLLLVMPFTFPSSVPVSGQ